MAETTPEAAKFNHGVGTPAVYITRKDNEFPDGQQKAAVITKVHENGNVNLQVYHDAPYPPVFRENIPADGEGVVNGWIHVYDPPTAE